MFLEWFLKGSISSAEDYFSHNDFSLSVWKYYALDNALTERLLYSRQASTMAANVTIWDRLICWSIISSFQKSLKILSCVCLSILYTTTINYITNSQTTFKGHSCASGTFYEEVTKPLIQVIPFFLFRVFQKVHRFHVMYRVHHLKLLFLTISYVIF